MTNILFPILVLGGLGLLFGVLLSIASKVFAVKIDPKVTELLDALPGANCGACGFPGCEGLAVAIANGEAGVNECPIGGQKVADHLAEIMGLNAVAVDRNVAVVKCLGDCELAKDKYIYDGINDCRVETFLADGAKVCSYGCLGCGTCFDVCEYDAIRMIDGLAHVVKENCTACMKCIDICPKNIIKLVPYEQEVIVQCMSEDIGRAVRGYCSIGCIACRICVRNCPEDAFIYENNIPRIDYSKCTNCGICVEKCPTKSITMTVDGKVVVDSEANVG